MRRQIREVRANRHQQHRREALARKRVITVSDLSDLQREDIHTRAQFSTSHKSGLTAELIQLGKEALQYTNEFRAEHKLPPLQWHQALCEIGYEHSRNMGEGKAPFSHDGFDQRVQQYPFPYRSAAENLAMNSGVSHAARAAVKGWIDSPGHRKNLLGRQTFCGIGVYCNARGAFYFTQLFGLL